MGPIGLFFARLARNLERKGVPVTKVSFPLYEFGFPLHQRVFFSAGMDEFQSFLRALILERGIRHIFMYGDFIDPHRLAIDLVQQMNAEKVMPFPIEAWVFELGYIRPNYVSLELERVNARSNLNQPISYYQSLPRADVIPQARRDEGIRWRKIWKMPTFIQHAFTPYPIIQGPHKLQPKPSYLLAQILGLIRKYLYRFSERSVRRQLVDGTPFVLVPLQVSSDSQVSLGSDYAGMEPFIAELIASFASHAPGTDRLVFKHHPRDRGYNHYGAMIRETARRHGVEDRVLYFHDGPLGPILKRAKAVLTINSTVGLQAIYHAVPTKVLGRTFYNLPGLTDQQPLAAFWQSPQSSDRDLFRRFYVHLIDTPQINGNVEGFFPFAKTFAISPELAIHAIGPRPSHLQILLRLCTLIHGFATYYLQLLALAFGARETARRLLEQGAQRVLKGLGVTVLMDRRAEPLSRPQLHIANHGHPLDVLLVQGHFRECSMTTAAQHLGWILPFFTASARNYGHTDLDHLSNRSRVEGLRRLLRVMEERGRLFLFPSGSLLTPITQRVSGSLYVLGRRSGALIIPWFTTYRGFPRSEDELRYRPLSLILRRLAGPRAIILCQEGSPIDPSDFPDQDALSRHIRELYAHRKVSLESIS
ncbi:MAG: 1-acyl-sn-glycerol-3-phosphate acyltransferase [Cyanobacteriota bacterium]